MTHIQIELPPRRTSSEPQYRKKPLRGFAGWRRGEIVTSPTQAIRGQTQRRMKTDQGFVLLGFKRLRVDNLVRPHLPENFVRFRDHVLIGMLENDRAREFVHSVHTHRERPLSDLSLSQRFHTSYCIAGNHAGRSSLSPWQIHRLHQPCRKHLHDS